LHFCALKYAGMRGLIIRKTRESLSEAALVTFEDKVLPQLSALKEGPKRNFRQAYHYPRGSEIVVGGLDKPGKIMSTEYDVIYVQEATELALEDWLALTTRLRNNVLPYQQLIADCNPDSPAHWLWLRAQSGEIRMLHSRHEENPRLWNGVTWTKEGLSYIATLDRLGSIDPKTGARVGTEYQRLRLGLWVQATGIVYAVWSDGPDDGNVTEQAEYIKDGGAILWSVDDGYSGKLDPATGHYTALSHPRVIGFYQQRSDGTLCRFDESYAVGLLSEDHIAQALVMPHRLEDVIEAGDERPIIEQAWAARERLGTCYPEPDFAVVDSSAAELRGRLRDADITNYGGTHPVDEGIKNMRRWVAKDANGRRRLRVHPRCRHFRYEMAAYRYDDKERPVKQHDHSMDECRMLVWKLREEG